MGVSEQLIGNHHKPRQGERCDPLYYNATSIEERFRKSRGWIIKESQME